MGSSALDYLHKIPVIGDTIDELSGKKGLDTAAQGARDAQAQANQLSQLQWQRQMEGLQRALGMMNPSQSLYDRIYGTNTAQTRNPQAGGMPPGMGGGSAGPINAGPGFPPVGRAPSPDGADHSGQTVGGTFAPVTYGGPPAPGTPNPPPASTPLPTPTRPGFGANTPGNAAPPIAAAPMMGASSPMAIGGPTNPYLARLNAMFGH